VEPLGVSLIDTLMRTVEEVTHLVHSIIKNTLFLCLSFKLKYIVRDCYCKWIIRQTTVIFCVLSYFAYLSNYTFDLFICDVGISSFLSSLMQHHAAVGSFPTFELHCSLLHQTACIRPPASDLLHQTACIRPPASDLLHQTSCIRPPASDRPHRSSEQLSFVSCTFFTSGLCGGLLSNHDLQTAFDTVQHSFNELKLLLNPD